jgi:hypothetical protein
MIKNYYIIVDGENREVNFYDSIINNSFNRAVQSAKQVEDSKVLLRKIDPTTKEKVDKLVWPV